MIDRSVNVFLRCQGCQTAEVVRSPASPLELPVRDRIRTATLTLFSERGFSATGIRDIAEAAGISTSLLYHYSRSKQELLQQLMAEGVDRHFESSGRALALANGPAESLFALVAVHLLVPYSNPLMARLIRLETRELSAAAREDLQAKREASDERWTGVLEQGTAAGVFTIGDIGLAGRLLRRMCTGTTSWLSPGGPSIDQAVGSVTDFALALVRAHRGQQPITAAELSNPSLAAIRSIVDDVHARERPSDR